MKKYIHIAIILLFAVSCENEIPFDVKENSKRLIVNALFDNEKEENKITLAFTGREQTTLVKDASIDIYINDELKDRITSPSTDFTYRTNVHFQPNDIIRIEAQTNDGKHRAWSEVIVPTSISIEKIDTAIVSKNSWWNNPDKFLRTKITFTDNGEKTNYYRIDVTIDCEIETISPVTTNDTIVYKTIREALYVNEDVVLTDGRPSSDQDEDGLLTPVQNYWGVFDNSRINGSYTMTTSLRIPYSSIGVLLSGVFVGGYVQYWEIKRIGMVAKARLLSISEMQYFYLKALNIHDSTDYDDFFNLPVRLPSNIEGGTGIFGVSVGPAVVIPLEDYIPYQGM